MNPKNIIRMCLATAFLLLGVSAAAKDNSLLQRTYSVNLSSPQATVKSFTRSFTEQTGVVFSYESSLADKQLGTVSLNEKNASLETILAKAFAGRGVDYNVVGSTVVLSETASPRAQSRPQGAVTVSGKVVDASGEPLAGAGVMIKGKPTKGTVTDINGNYSLQADPSETLVFSFIGYKEEEVRIGNRGVINVALEVDQSLLDDVVVIGYGS